MSVIRDLVDSSTAQTVSFVDAGNLAVNHFIPLSTSANGTDIQLKTDSGLYYNASTNYLYSPYVSSTYIYCTGVYATSFISIDDTDQYRMGTSDDAKLWYDGTANYMQIELESTCNGIQITDNGTDKVTIDRATGNISTVGGFDLRETVTAGTNAIDFSADTVTTRYELTATATTMSATVGANSTGKCGIILVHSAENITGWDAIFKFKTTPTDLTGDEVFAYYIEDTSNIWIGRVL